MTAVNRPACTQEGPPPALLRLRGYGWAGRYPMSGNP